MSEMNGLEHELATAFHNDVEEARRHGVHILDLREYIGELNKQFATYAAQECLDEDYVNQLPVINVDQEDERTAAIQAEKDAGQAAAELDASISLVDFLIEQSIQERTE